MTKLSVLVSTVAAVAVLALVVTLFAAARTVAANGATSTTVTVKGGEFFFRLSQRSLAKPGAVTFRFTNIGHVAHDFMIGGKKTSLVSPGKSASLIIRFKAKGKFPYLCTVPGHAEAGMKGTFTVR
jgi:uncharacterized cupredoxin-like copper-binding protein